MLYNSVCWDCSTSNEKIMRKYEDWIIFSKCVQMSNKKYFGMSDFFRWSLSLIKYIGLATKSFRFFPLDDFSRSKSFFSIENLRPYMLFDIKSRYSSKKDYAECLVGFQRYYLFWAAPKEPNYQFECLLSPANEIQYNARTHTSLGTRKKLLELGWEVMPHPPV